MRHFRMDRNSSRLWLLICLLFALLPPAIAYAGTQYTYYQGVGGAGSTFSTTGYAARDYNQVWHQAGRTWAVWYADTSGNVYGYVRNTSNPTKWPNPIGYAKSKCQNVNDTGPVLWTCQTTQP